MKRTSADPVRVSVPAVIARKSTGPKITVLTAYDFTMARIFDEAGIDVILVGDSAGSVVQGEPTTIPVTLDQMVYHSRCVARGTTRALVVGDMPFMSYQISPERALESAGRLMKEGGVGAVKLEGGIYMAETIARIARVDIPVMGHVGLTPQSYHRIGGYRVQGRESSSGDSVSRPGTRERVIEDALAVEAAGAFAVVLECIPPELAAEITARLTIPTIGIGAGAGCDGQVLVCADMLGMTQGPTPKFAKRFAEIGEAIGSAARQYIAEVRDGSYPDTAHTLGAKKAAEAKLKLV